MAVVLRTPDNATSLAAGELAAVVGLGSYIADHTPGMPADRRTALKAFLTRAESAVPASNGAYASLELSDEDRTLLEFVWAQSSIRGRLPVRVRHVCETCATETISNPDHDRLRERNRKRVALAGLGVVLGPATVNPFLLIGTLLRLRSVDPDFVCPRCKGLESDDSPATFCPRCKAQRAEAVLLACPDCGHDFGDELRENIEWRSRDAFDLPPPSPTREPTFRVAHGCRAVATSGDGRWLAMAGAKGGARVFDLSSPEAAPIHVAAARFGSREWPYDAVVLSGDGRRLACLARGRWIPQFTVFDVDPEGDSSSATARRDFSARGARTKSVALSPDGRRFATGSRVLDVERDGALICDVGAAVGWNLPSVFVESVAFSPDGSLLAAAAAAALIVIDVDTGIPLMKLPAGKRVVGVRFGGENATRLAIVWNERRPDSHVLRVYDVSRRDQLYSRTIEGHATGVDVDAAGRLAAVSTGAGSVLVWDTTSGDVRHRLAPGCALSGVAFAAGGSRVVVGLGSGAVRLFDVPD